VEWIGHGVQDGWNLHYREVLLNEESLKVGDCALAASNRSGDDPYICQIIGLYEDQNKEQFANVRWFYRSAEVHATLHRLHIKKQLPVVTEKCNNAEEIYAGHEDTIGIIAICGRCCVRVGNYPTCTTEEYSENALFCVNHFFNNRTGSLHPLTVVICELDKTTSMKKSETQYVELSGNFRLCLSENIEEMTLSQSSVRHVSKYILRSPASKNFKSSAEDYSEIAIDFQRKSYRKRKRGSNMKLPDDYQVSSESTEESDDEMKMKKSKCKSKRRCLKCPKFPTRPVPCILPSNAFEEARCKYVDCYSSFFKGIYMELELSLGVLCVTGNTY
jgi:hypothetical protein